MSNIIHLIALKHGKYVNLSHITTAVCRDDQVKLWYLGEDGCETFLGDDAEALRRRLDALAFVTTDEIEIDIAAVPVSHGAERPRA